MGRLNVKVVYTQLVVELMLIFMLDRCLMPFSLTSVCQHLNLYQTSISNDSRVDQLTSSGGLRRTPVHLCIYTHAVAHKRFSICIPVSCLWHLVLSSLLWAFPPCPLSNRVEEVPVLTMVGTVLSEGGALH